MSTQTFSERYGYSKVRDILQKDDMNHSLKVAIWNFIYEDFLEFSNTIKKLIWTDFFHLPVDEIYSGEVHYKAINIPKIKSLFEKLDWFQIYDLLEFIAQNDDLFEEEDVNYILEKFCSAYRLIGEQIVELTSEAEIKEIETAINSPLEEMNEHLQKSLHLLSNRENPDYRNSIKESISAVECICRKITGKSTLGKALADLEKKGLKLNSQLKEGLSHLYSYTNDENGIRHSIMDMDEEVNMEEARFMLVTCSAFVNYLLEKANKLGIKL